jgi:hypothetical protein
MKKSGIYILFKTIDKKKYFKIGKSISIDERVQKLNKDWGHFDKTSIAITIKNNNFKTHSETGLSFEKIVLKSLLIFGYKKMNNQLLKNNSGYTEFFELKESETALDIIDKVKKLLLPYSSITTFQYSGIIQSKNNIKITTIETSSLIPQQISIFHIKYYFEQLSNGTLLDWDKELKEISRQETIWKKENGYAPQSNKASGKSYNEYKLVQNFNKILNDNKDKPIEKSHNKNTVGYIKTFINSVLKYFKKSINKINFDSFLLLLKRILKDSKLSKLYEEFETDPKISNNTVTRRKLNIVEWVKLQFRIYIL